MTPHLTSVAEKSHAPVVAAKSVAGRENPNNREARKRRNLQALFLRPQLSVCGGRAGQASAWPVSFRAGFSLPHVRHQSRVRTGGGGSSYRKESHHA